VPFALVATLIVETNGSSIFFDKGKEIMFPEQEVCLILKKQSTKGKSEVKVQFEIIRTGPHHNRKSTTYVGEK
jgi:hypothetical protein